MHHLKVDSIAKWANVSYNGARMITFGSLNITNNDDYDAIDVVKISKIFAILDAFFVGAWQLDRFQLLTPLFDYKLGSIFPAWCAPIYAIRSSRYICLHENA